MNSACPNCGCRVEPRARYCPDCYTVFASDQQSRRAGGGQRSRTGSKAWGFALALFVALGGAWLYQIDTEDWSAEPGSIQASARDMKRRIVALVASDADAAAERREGPRVERADVRQSERGCAISRTVSNRGSEPVAPVIVTFSFKAANGTTVGQSVSATIDEPLPAGASRQFTFEVPCPEMFSSVRARSARPEVEVGASGRGSSAEERLAWTLENDSRLPCALGAACEVVIRFPSGHLANYLIERSRGRTRFYALDQRGIDLLSAASRADLVVRAPGGGTRAVPINRQANDRWFIVDERRLSAADGRSSNGGL